jgi:TolB-like protein
VTDVISRIHSQYFADGMTEELITGLGKIHSLRVISRQPVMQYLGIQPG